MQFPRTKYLEQLINAKHNGLIKIITGIRLVGKSYLLFNLFKQHLIDSGIEQAKIIEVQLDDYDNRELLDTEKLYNYIKNHLTDDDQHYLLLDEIQLVPHFESLLNGLLHRKNLDIYVTGSNSKFLSSDIITEFRGRGDEIRIYPLTFAECCNILGNDSNALKNYMIYGGLPLTVLTKNAEKKQSYLKNAYKNVYLNDILQRHNIKNVAEFDELIKILSSEIGSLTNPKKLSDTFNSVKNVKIAPATVETYINFIIDSFLIEKSMRYDVKGKKYISTPSKYYFTDLGLRNAVIEFRQFEQTHLMENLIYNELKYRGFDVDVGVVSKNVKNENGNGTKTSLEIDFVANKSFKRFYIQSAYSIADSDKLAQEEASLDNVKDNFPKVIVVYDSVMPYYQNGKGYIIVGLNEFLTNIELVN